MAKCLQELCANWNGDGAVCTCALIGVEPDTDVVEHDESAWMTVSSDYQEEDIPYPPTHPLGPRGIGHLEGIHLPATPDRQLVSRLMPREEAVRLVAEQTGLSEEQVSEYAQQMKQSARVEPMVSLGALVAVSNAFGNTVRAAMKVTPEAEAVGIRADYGRLYYNGTDLTPYIQVRALPEQLPHKPADRRTIHLLGKPYHYVQTEDGLKTQPGESPWE